MGTRLVTVEEMRALERRAFDSGVRQEDLMETAGTAVGRAAAEWLANPRGRRVLVLAGSGNNGGDALIAARVLARDFGAEPRVYLVADRRGDPLLAWAAPGTPTEVHGEAAAATLHAWLAEAEVVVVGVLGIGSRRPLRGAGADVMAACRSVRPRGQRRIAVDVPTGVHADTGQADPLAFQADLTLSTGPAKPGLYIHPGAECAGHVRALDIGIGGFDDDPDGAVRRATARAVAALLPPRPDDSHKGTYGKVLVVAGSGRYVGAAYLAGAAAVRAGAGLVTLAIPEAAQRALAGRSVETTFLPLSDDAAAPGCLTPAHADVLLSAAESYDAVALGPGIGADQATQRLVLVLLAAWAAGDGPRVLLDADALNAMAAAGDGDGDGGGQWPRPRDTRWVLTPHPGEMSRLTRTSTNDIQADRLAVARRWSRTWGQVVVLKGAPSIIATASGSATLNAFANAALATAGSGDVLSGATAALLAQGCAPYAAAVAGSYVHALAAELWRAEYGAAGLAAGHLVEYLPAAEADLRRQA
jgi:NAD(P)H-hydrate epimerase